MDRLTMFKVAEMSAPSRSPSPVQSAGFGNGMGAAGPQFLDATGNPISSVESGAAYGFNVPGYSSVWLMLKKDGAMVYNAAFALPMALHTAQDSEIGAWQAVAYDLQSGQIIGSAASLQIVPGGTGTGTSTGVMAWLSALTPTQKALGAAAVLFLMTRKGKL